MFNFRLSSGASVDVLGCGSYIYKNHLDQGYLMESIDRQCKSLSAADHVLIDFSAPQSWVRLVQYFSFVCTRKYSISISFHTKPGDSSLFLSSGYRKSKSLQSFMFYRLLRSKLKSQVVISNLVTSRKKETEVVFLGLREGYIQREICDVSNVKKSFEEALLFERKQVLTDGAKQVVPVKAISGFSSRLLFCFKLLISKSLIISATLIDIKRVFARKRRFAELEEKSEIYLAGGLSDYFINCKKGFTK